MVCSFQWMSVYAAVIASLLIAANSLPECFEPYDRVVSRWKNGNYYKGSIQSLTNVMNIIFDNNVTYRYNLQDTVNVLPDREPDESKLTVGARVVVNRPHSRAYQIGYIRDLTGGRYLIWFEDGSYIYRSKNDIRTFNQTHVCDEPAYLGCYRDQIPRLLSVYIPTKPATIGACVDMCKAQGFSIAALMNSNLCFCGLTYNKKYQGAENKCDIPCYDNLYEICGGSNSYSQYWTGIPRHSSELYQRNRKHAIPRYGALPWTTILAARNEVNEPQWQWEPSTRSWTKKELTAMGEYSTHWHGEPYSRNGWTWNGQTWAPDLRMRTTTQPTIAVMLTAPPANYISMSQNAPLPSPPTSYSSPLLSPPMSYISRSQNSPLSPSPNMRYDYTRRKYVPIYFQRRQYKMLTNHRTGAPKTKGTQPSKKNPFNEDLVLEKLADRMDHIKWSHPIHKSFKNAVKQLPPDAPVSYRYLGCYRDDIKRDLPYFFYIKPLTVRSCIVKCRSEGYSVAGVQSSWQCNCGNKYSKYGRVREEQCDMKCGGDNKELCGGALRNAIYYTGVGEAMPFPIKQPVKNHPVKGHQIKGHQIKEHQIKKHPVKEHLVKGSQPNINKTGISKASTKSYQSLSGNATVSDEQMSANKTHGKSKLHQIHQNSIHQRPASHSESKVSSNKLSSHVEKAKQKSLQQKKTAGKSKIRKNNHHEKNSDDFEVESIKVKVNFSDLKKALEAFSPEIVKKVRADLEKMDRMTKTTRTKAQRKKLEVHLDETVSVKESDLEKELNQLQEKSRKVIGKIKVLKKNRKVLAKSGKMLKKSINLISKNIKEKDKKPEKNDKASLKVRLRSSKKTTKPIKAHSSPKKSTKLHGKGKAEHVNQSPISLHETEKPTDLSKQNVTPLKPHDEGKKHVETSSNSKEIKKLHSPESKRIRQVNHARHKAIAKASHSVNKIHLTKDDHDSNQPITNQHASKQPITDHHASNQPITNQHKSNQPITNQHTSNQPITNQHGHHERIDIGVAKVKLTLGPKSIESSAVKVSQESNENEVPVIADSTANQSSGNQNSVVVNNKGLTLADFADRLSVESKKPSSTKNSLNIGNPGDGDLNVLLDPKLDSSSGTKNEILNVKNDITLGDNFSGLNDEVSPESEPQYIDKGNTHASGESPINDHVTSKAPVRSMEKTTSELGGDMDSNQEGEFSMAESSGVTLPSSADLPEDVERLKNFMVHGSGAIEVDSEDNDTSYIYFANHDKDKSLHMIKSDEVELTDANQTAADTNADKLSLVKTADVDSKSNDGDEGVARESGNPTNVSDDTTPTLTANTSHPASEVGTLTQAISTQADIKNPVTPLESSLLTGNNSLTNTFVELAKRSHIPSPVIVKVLNMFKAKTKATVSKRKLARHNLLRKTPRKLPKVSKRVGRSSHVAKTVGSSSHKREGRHPLPITKREIIERYAKISALKKILRNRSIRSNTDMKMKRDKHSSVIQKDRRAKYHHISERRPLKVKAKQKRLSRRSVNEEDEEGVEEDEAVLQQRFSDHGARNEVVWRGSRLQERASEIDETD